MDLTIQEEKVFELKKMGKKLRKLFEENTNFNVSNMILKNYEHNETWFDLTIREMEWEGVGSFLLHLIDIGGYKQIDDYKNKIFATVSHNLRTPLTNILGNLEIGLKTAIDKEQKALVQSSYFSALYLNNSVNDILGLLLKKYNEFEI